MYFTIDITFDHTLQMNFPELVQTEDFTSKLTDTKPLFLFYYETLQTQKETWKV